jgi:hypothetical protein
MIKSPIRFRVVVIPSYETSVEAPHFTSIL